MNAQVLANFCRTHCTPQNRHQTVRSVTSNPQIKSYVDRHRIAIAIANDVLVDPTYLPTMLQLCVFLGKKVRDEKKGIFDPMTPPIAKQRWKFKDDTFVEENARFPSWPHYFEVFFILAKADFDKLVATQGMDREKALAELKPQYMEGGVIKCLSHVTGRSAAKADFDKLVATQGMDREKALAELKQHYTKGVMKWLSHVTRH